MRLLAAARLTYGASLLLGSPVALPVSVRRILGARHVAQALTLDRAGARGWILFGAGVDLLHALSMVLWAAASANYRRAAALDAALALGLAAHGPREARHG